MRFGRGRRRRRERPAGSIEPLILKLQEVRKKHEELVAELAEAQRLVADAGSTRLRLEEQLKALKGRAEAKDIAERYEQAAVREKNLIGYEEQTRKKLDVFIAQKTKIEEQVAELRSLIQTD